MARSIWNGTITFGLTTVPIKVHSAIEPKTVDFHQVHAKDGARIRQKRICSKEGKEVPYKEVAKGYEVRGGEFVLLTHAINAAAGESAHLIELEEFVRAEQIDPVYYDRPNYLGAGKEPELPRAGGAWPVRDAGQGVPGDRPPARRSSDPNHDAVRRRGPRPRGGRRRHPEVA